MILSLIVVMRMLFYLGYNISCFFLGLHYFVKYYGALVGILMKGPIDTLQIK